MSLKAGDYIEIRSAEEILATLDDEGCLDKLPFMPEMLRYCGKTIRVASSAHKTCDTISQTGGRRMRRAVHLEGVRCDGSSHGNCEAGCLIFWKHEWLKRPGEESKLPEGEPRLRQRDLAAATDQRDSKGEPVYRCQATCLFAATQALSKWDLRQYVRDLLSRNVSIGRLIGAFSFALFDRIVKLGFGYRALIAVYNRFQDMRGRHHYPFATGSIPKGSPTPMDILDLESGDTVRVKPLEEILSTLDTSNKNRGLWFDAEMVPFCERTYRVSHRVNRLIEESTGKMVEMKAPCIVLDGVFCKSFYSGGRLFCPRAIHSYWRESWLERVPDGTRLPKQLAQSLKP